ncbi:MAG: hypothetical protein K9J21_05570 [Bacteroidales bacterium]|nr:hypothetical protein [Bacteroidales bacterium]
MKVFPGNGTNNVELIKHETSMAWRSSHRRMIKGLDELDNAKNRMSFVVISSHLLSLMVIGSH